MKALFIVSFSLLAVILFPVTFALMALSPAFVDSEKE